MQIVGKKRYDKLLERCLDCCSFTFVMPYEHELMHPFPRVHPLWHKSQMDFLQPDLAMFPDYELRHALVAEVQPGYACKCYLEKVTL